MGRVSLSKTGKMPCKSWSIPAFYSCPGSIIEQKVYNGKLQSWEDFKSNHLIEENKVEVCKGCYATSGFYQMPNSKTLREHNLEDWKRDDWVKDMSEALKGEKYFRFFDSGDVYCIELAEKIYEIALRCSETKFWIPTLAHRIPAIRKTLAKLNKLQNVVVRCSSPNLNTPVQVKGIDTTSFVSSDSELKSRPSRLVCQAYNRQGKCGDCRACWQKEVKEIIYPAHGNKMKGVIKRKVLSV